ncbi:glycosyltransferase family 2 protein [Streptomyces flavovirens]|uniref:glycosyltransferase family 2 protein n=1 Tax=Streptomyces TaxID=1883 RepID=UPI00081BB5EA|nr:glycosyltransferase family 2 protein [Streptomyces sp. BpilaLS-43]SCD42202.1 Glycosyl transferase family 2 [Streptomyces sp. BpilaLS-43]
MKTPVSPALVAVVGPVEPALLAAWTAHYRRLGIERFHLAFHFPDHIHDAWRHQLIAAGHDLGIVPARISTGPWHEHTNTQLRNFLREQAGTGWHLIADSDEFQTYPAPLTEMIARAEAAKHKVIGGLMLDRATNDGRLALWRPEIGLDRSFPLGGHLTHRLLKGDPRKIVLAHSSVALASGNHRAPGHKPDPDTLACVHHFKWRSGVLDDLHRRVDRFTSGEWAEHTPAVRSEASRLLQHIERHNGRIDVADPHLAFRHVTLDRLPSGWATEAAKITAIWRPHTAQSQPGSTISSPSS